VGGGSGNMGVGSWEMGGERLVLEVGSWELGVELWKKK